MAHYLPFYLMGRQLFLHHYLPAHLASALVMGAVLEFVFNIEPLDLDEPSYTEVSKDSRKKDGQQQMAGKRHLPARERLGHQSLLAAWAATGLVLTVVIGSWYYFLPLTYGKPGLSAEEVVARKWLGYDLHFAK
jgi:dolichyl-phosphate-mannose-protein mannosyltransferase